MANFVHATFSGAAADFDPFTGYVGEVGGAWTNRGGDSAAKMFTSGEVAGFDASGWWTAAGTPAGADYSCTGKLHLLNQTFARGGGPLGRWNSANGRYYMFMYNYNVLWILYYYDGSTFNIIDQVSASGVVDGNTYDLKLEMIGTAIKGYVDGVQKCAATHSGVTVAGLAGLYLDSNYSRYTQFDADDIGGASTISAGVSESVTVTDSTLVLQTLRPSSDTAAGLWTPSSGGVLYAMLNEAVANPANYIQSSDNPTNDVCKIKLSAGVAPLNTSVHSIQIQAKWTGGPIALNVSLHQSGNGTAIASWTPTLTSSDTIYNLTLTPTQAANITDPANLELWFAAG